MYGKNFWIFSQLRITGEVLAGLLKGTLLKYGIDFRDQGYDGASNMEVLKLI